LALLSPCWLALLEKTTRLLSPTLEKLTNRLNAPVQGTAADGLKLALDLLWERRGECPRAVPVLVCHDEVVVECDADKAEEAKEWLVQAMKDGMDAVVNVMGPHIPIEVEASVSKTWGG
jgi:DNA polymerase I-like protein with 3'-5' exonuclease and polymerase domains